MKTNYQFFPPKVAMMKVTNFLIVFFMLFLISFSSFAQNQSKQYFNSKLKANTKVGYLAYTPPGYNDNSNDYPVIIFLHGIGERGSNLDLVSRNGPPRAIKNGIWPENYPFIVISPQSPFSFPSSWDPDLVNEVINVVKNKYRIATNRIYVTGFSMGGNGAWTFAAKYPDVPAAIVPMAGWGDKSTACNMKNLPIWAFHGQADARISVNKTKEMVNAVNACGGNAKGTYPSGAGHTQALWETAYKPDHSKYNPNIYDWMLSKSKSGENTTTPNKAPYAKAGADKTLTLPNNSVVLYGSGEDSDGKIVAFNWSKVSGPTVTLKNASTSNLSLSYMVAGEYQFKLTVKDNNNATASDVVKVTVKEAIATTSPADGKSGLIYSYYEGSWSTAPNFSNLSAKKTGNISNFSLSQKLRDDYFGFMFKGYIEIKTGGTYTFYTGSDDGSELYIGSKKVVDNDGLHSYKEKNGSIYLGAGKHPIRVVYFEAKGGERLDVKYAGPGIGKQVIPNGVLFTEGSSTSPSLPSGSENGLSYSYYEGSWSTAPNFNNLSAKKTGNISNFSLSQKLRDNYFGFMFKGYIEIKTGGTYTFYTGSDDGSELYIGSKKVVDNDGLHSYKEKNGSIYLGAGKHPIKVVYFEAKGGERLDVKYAGPGIGKQVIPNGALFRQGTATEGSSSGENGLAYSYYEGSWSTAPNFSNLSAKKTGKVNNFILTPRLRDDYFGVTFQGYVEIKAGGTYTFYTGSDDGSELYIGNKKVVDNDGLHSYRERYGKIALSAGKHFIKVVYFEAKGGESLKVKYAGPGIGKQVIPDKALFINGSGATTTSSTRMVTSGFNEPASKSIVYPNSFENEINVDFVGTKAKTVQMSIIDQTGRVYFNETRKILSVNGEVKIDLYDKEMSAGIYFLKLNYDEGESEVIRLLKK